jgi:hypothetical protein
MTDSGTGVLGDFCSKRLSVSGINRKAMVFIVLGGAAMLMRTRFFALFARGVLDKNCPKHP